MINKHENTDNFDVIMSERCGEPRYEPRNCSMKKLDFYFFSSRQIHYLDNADLTLNDATEEKRAEIVVNRLTRWIITKENPCDIFARHLPNDLNQEQRDMVANSLKTLENCSDKLCPNTVMLVYRLLEMELDRTQIGISDSQMWSSIVRRVNRAVSFYMAMGIDDIWKNTGMKCSYDTWWTTLASPLSEPYPYQLASACVGLKYSMRLNPNQFKNINKLGFFNPNLNTSWVYELDIDKWCS